MKKIILISLFLFITLISCNMYVNEKAAILMFNEDYYGNHIESDDLNFILFKRENENGLTYMTGIIENNNELQNVKIIEEAKYLENVKYTNNIKDLNTNDYINKMKIKYDKKEIIFIDIDNKEYTLPLNNDTNTWIQKLLSETND